MLEDSGLQWLLSWGHFSCRNGGRKCAKVRKLVETVFSQLCDQYMVIRNYAKQTDGLLACIIGKISALTVAQNINYINNQPIGRVEHSLV